MRDSSSSVLIGVEHGEFACPFGWDGEVVVVKRVVERVVRSASHAAAHMEWPG